MFEESLVSKASWQLELLQRLVRRAFSRQFDGLGRLHSRAHLVLSVRVHTVLGLGQLRKPPLSDEAIGGLRALSPVHEPTWSKQAEKLRS